MKLNTSLPYRGRHGPGWEATDRVDATSLQHPGSFHVGFTLGDFVGLVKFECS